LSGLAPFSFTTLRFGKRANRHIIGSQNDLSYLMRGYLENAAPPLEGDQLRKVEDSLNKAPMSYLEMKSPRVALLHRHDTSSNFSYNLQKRLVSRARLLGRFETITLQQKR
jgi:hypothetical protein